MSLSTEQQPPPNLLRRKSTVSPPEQMPRAATRSRRPSFAPQISVSDDPKSTRNSTSNLSAPNHSPQNQPLNNTSSSTPAARLHAARSFLARPNGGESSVSHTTSNTSSQVRTSQSSLYNSNSPRPSSAKKRLARGISLRRPPSNSNLSTAEAEPQPDDFITKLITTQNGGTALQRLATPAAAPIAPTPIPVAALPTSSAAFNRRLSEFKITIPLFVTEKSGRTIVVEGITHDLDRLITMSLKSRNSSGNFAVLRSNLFEKFLKNACFYARAFIREKLALTHDRLVQTSGVDVPPSLIHFLSELNKTEYQCIDKEDLKKSRKEVEDCLQALSSTYFKLLLSSNCAYSPSKERALFECVYTVTVDVVCQLLSSYNVSYLIIHELQRSFRSDFFKPSMAEILKDPQFNICFKFLNALKSPYEKPRSNNNHLMGGFRSKQMDSENHSKRQLNILLPIDANSSSAEATNRMWEMRKSIDFANRITDEKGAKIPPAPLIDTGAKKRVSLNAVSMLRSPLAESGLPSVQII